MRWNPVEQIQDVANKFGTEERIRRFQSGELVLVERNEAQKRGVILRFERKASIVALRFVASESFTRSNAKMKFSYIDERFLELFGNIREDVPAGEIAVNTLLEDKHDPDIMVALGPQFVRYTKLGQFYQLLEAQGQGQSGPLLVNGYATIAYIIDKRRAPWAVGANWSSDGWNVNFNSVAGLYGWNADCQVLSQVA